MRRRSGFTLIEMMIVLAIIAALAATLVPIAMNALNQAKVTQNLTDLESIRMAAMQYYYKFDGVGDVGTVDKLDMYLNKANLGAGPDMYTIEGSPTTNTLSVRVKFSNANLAKALEAQYPFTSETSGTTLDSTPEGTGGTAVTDGDFVAHFVFQ